MANRFQSVALLLLQSLPLPNWSAFAQSESPILLPVVEEHFCGNTRNMNSNNFLLLDYTQGLFNKILIVNNFKLVVRTVHNTFYNFE